MEQEQSFFNHSKLPSYVKLFELDDSFINKTMDLYLTKGYVRLHGQDLLGDLCPKQKFLVVNKRDKTIYPWLISSPHVFGENKYVDYNGMEYLVHMRYVENLDCYVVFLELL